MNRLHTLSIVALFTFAGAAGCSAAPDDEATSRDHAALDGCDPADSACACPPDDTSCVPPNVPPVDPCAPTEAKGLDESCDLFWGWAWDGSACLSVSGCECKGACDALYKTADDCKVAHEICSGTGTGGGGDFCAQAASDLAALLAQAQACNIASADAAQCSAFVPTIGGCYAPVASAGSEYTEKYLDLYDAYVASCPLPVPACPDPSTIKAGCVQGPDVDGLVGACEILAPSADAASAAD